MRKILVSSAFVSVLSSVAVAAPLNTVQYTGDAAFQAAAGAGGDKAVAEFRWGNNNPEAGVWEFAVGNPTSNATTQSQGGHKWTEGNQTWAFLLTYDGAGGLTLDFSGEQLTHAITVGGYSALALRADGRKGDPTISNLKFNDMAFGPLTADDVVSYIALTNVDVMSAWTLSGDIFFNSVNDGPDGGNNNQSRPSFQVKLADLPVSEVPLPAAVWSLLAGLAGLGFIGRRRTSAAT